MIFPLEMTALGRIIILLSMVLMRVLRTLISITSPISVSDNSILSPILKGLSVSIEKAPKTFEMVSWAAKATAIPATAI